MNTFTKILKRVAIGFGVSFVLSTVIGLFLLLKILPGPAQIAKQIKSPSVSASTGHQNVAENAPANSNTTDGAPATNPQASNQADNTTSTADGEQKAKAIEIITQMIDEDPRDLRVCQNLAKAKKLDMEPAADGKKASFNLFEDELRENPIVEAEKYTIKTVFQDEALAPLMKDIIQLVRSDSTAKNEDALKDKVSFYSRAAYAAGSLFARRAHFEYIGNRASHLEVIAKIAAERPDLAMDPSLTGFCESLQRSLTEGQVVDLKQERQELLKLIAYAGLTPEKLGFNPQSYMKFKINNSEKGLNFTFKDDGQQN